MTPPLFVGKNLVIINEVDSTNNHLVKLLQHEKVYEGTAVVADHQLSGRGQQNNKWESEQGKNLLMSILLYPGFLNPRRNFMLNIAFSLGVSDFFKPLIPKKEVKVKWPNDIFCGNRKLAGVLIENNIRGNKITQTIVGVGANINQTNFMVATNATSAAIEAGEEFKREKLMLQLFAALEKRYLQLRNGNFKELITDYHANLYKFGVLSRYKKADDREFEGMIRGVDEEGRLIIESDTKQNCFSYKEVVFLE